MVGQAIAMISQSAGLRGRRGGSRRGV